MAVIGRSGTVEETKVKLHKAFGLVEKFLVDEYIVGNTLTVADFSFVSVLETINSFDPIPSEKYPKTVAYIEKVIKQLPYFEDINREGIDILVNYIKSLKK